MMNGKFNLSVITRVVIRGFVSIDGFISVFFGLLNFNWPGRIMLAVLNLLKKAALDENVYVLGQEPKKIDFILISDTNPTIQKFLNHDTSFRLADKYLIAMVFIYFKRAELSPEDYTYLNFFAGLCLAHSMEEDIELSSEIYPWALGNELKNELPRLLELKTLLWMAMDYRAAVSQHCCRQLISISANHPVWQRERSPLCMTHLVSKEADRDFPDSLPTSEAGRKTPPKI